MSAPPMDAVRCQPSTPATAATATSAVTAASGAAAAKNARAATTDAASMPALSRFLPGSVSAAESMMPCSFPNATNEPVSVSAPIQLPSTAVTLCVMSSAASSAALPACAITDAMAVADAAKPTRLWKPATICGSSVILMDRAIAAPAAAPAAIRPAACASTAAPAPAASMPTSVVATPPVTPTTPSAVPVRADAWCDRHPIDAMHSADDTR
mmetsp:Transcript_5266/g.15936  ORF Transcript_5266/g.15936 Transcript_5266/m.15936 type:complete len:212 (+) Transcript_5266:1603-2238(+)